MDDEEPRIGIKHDLTTRDEYLASRFTKLSCSGHDLTPLSPDEIQFYIEKLHYSTNLNSGSNSTDTYLGHNTKGIYVNKIGGLPLFTSGYRLDELCNSTALAFSAPCDEEHVKVDNNLIICSRSNVVVGKVCAISDIAIIDTSETTTNGVSIFLIHSDKLDFYDLTTKLPIESQPENFWGTEGIK